MYTDVQICNLGLGKISQSRVKRIDTPVTQLEIYVKEGYTSWKRSELTKRRWVFALNDRVVLPKVAELTDVDQPYKYELPTQVLRPVRQRYTEWKQRGRFIYSGEDNLAIQCVMNVPEAEFDPLFVDVLAWRIAGECVEYVTQSNQKKADTLSGYKTAKDEAGKMNAFIIGPEDVAVDDNDFSFVTSRYL